MTNEPIIFCPHCKEPIIIEKINCGIFRCGILKKDNTQINPHLDQESCEKLIKNEEIFGCSRPFRILPNYTVEICDYI